MPAPSAILLFCLAAAALLIVPGPSVMYVVTRSLDQGRAAGLVSVLGIGVGTLCHIAAAALGLSALLISSSGAFAVVKYVGAAYLVFIGIRKLIEPDEAMPQALVREESLRRIFTDGVVVNVFNPKTALFFLAFLPQFVDVSRGGVPVQIVTLGAILVLMGLINDGAYALLAAYGGDWLRASPRFARVRRYVPGGVYLGLGVAGARAGARPAGK
jgi:threonine/homoserine/homoserine lactone efflux protein